MRTRAAHSRRRVMSALALGAGALALPSWAHADPMAARPQTVHGRVVDAQVRNGANAGIAGVMVSNGRDVSLTDDEGRWTLTALVGEAVFVIKPPHWRLASNARSAFYRFVAPGNAHIEFALARAHEPSAFEALLIADTQPADMREMAYLDTLLTRSLSHADMAFAIHHGDVMADDLSLFPRHLEIVGRSPFFWHHCPGNHDMDLGAGSHSDILGAWRRHLGPTHYAFQHGDATFILLNNVAPVPTWEKARGPRYRGHIGRAQLAFVQNILRYVSPESFLAVSMHIPLVSFDTPDSPSDTTSDRDSLLALLARHPRSVSFAGHSHTTEHHYLRAGHGAGMQPHHHHVLTAASGSWWSGPRARDGIPLSVSRDGTPKGFHVLSVDRSAYATRFVAFDDEDRQPARVLAIDGGATLLVDVFDGGPKTRVCCATAGRPSTAHRFERRAICDPYAAQVFARHASLCKPWVKASPSSHIWIGPRPDGGGPFVVSITDEYGRSRSVPVPARHLVPA